MFSYYLELALRSLKRSPGLTALMVLTMGFGVAASMTTYAVFRAVSGNPIPDKSSQLFKPQIDNWGPASGDKGAPPNAMDYTDAMALIRDRAAPLQTVLYPVNLSIVPGQASSQPFLVSGYATYSDFFRMFDVPFQYGSAWPDSDDARRGASIVIGSELNQRLFGGGNSVGQSIAIGANAYARDRGMAILMGVISTVLLAVTAAGIVGLTSFWVGQRRKQIGVRRALGATRRDILSYFLTENLMIAIAGVVLGAILALAMNQWLMHAFEMQRLSWSWIASGVIVLLALGQAAVLAPALRAARVPPVVATRSV